MEILTWIIVGFVAGALAAYLLGGIGLGIVGDILVGIAGAFIGAWIFREAGWAAPWGGLGGTIFIAFIGAVVLLLLVRLVSGGFRRRL